MAKSTDLQTGRPGPNAGDCHEVRDHLGAILDGEVLSREDVDTVDAHFESCEACQQYEWELREDWRLLGALPAADVDGGAEFLAGVHRRLEASRPRVRLPWWVATAAAAAAAAVLLYGALLFRPSPAAEDEEQILQNLEVLEELEEVAGDLRADEIEQLVELVLADASLEDAELIDVLPDLFLEEELDWRF